MMHFGGAVYGRIPNFPGTTYVMRTVIMAVLKLNRYQCTWFYAGSWDSKTPIEILMILYISSIDDTVFSLTGIFINIIRYTKR